MNTLDTLLGFLALLFWSGSVAFSRSVAEGMGTLNTAFFNMLFSGLVLAAVQVVMYGRSYWAKVSRLTFGYYWRVGVFMVLYMVVFYVAVGEAVSREAVIVVGIINYLWPGLIFLFAVPLLGLQGRYGLLALGIVTAFGGTVWAVLEGNRISVSHVSAALAENVWPYVLAFIGAVAWGLYSNMARKYKSDSDVVSVPLLFLISAGVVLVIQLGRGEVPRLVLGGWRYVEFGGLVLFPTALAYLFWNRAMRGGNKDLVVLVSYLVPVVSTWISGLYLGVPIGFGFWGGALLVLVGALLCRFAMREKPTA